MRMRRLAVRDLAVNLAGSPAAVFRQGRHSFLMALLAVFVTPVLPASAWAEPVNPTGVAVIIGNANYEHRDVPPVDFAHRDAAAFQRYVVDVLGYDPANVIDLPDASRRELIDVFGTRTNPEGLLWSYLDPAGGSDVVVFYSGHGVPGTDDGRGYLLPVDADPNAAADDGYPIDLLHRNVGGLAEARSVRVYLDACFSGGSHAGRSLIRNASPVYVAATLPEDVAGKVTALAAASGEQVASWDEAARHGLFTHHLLDALYGSGDADGDGRVTAAEAKAYLDRHMTRAARRQHRRIQQASLVGAADAVLASAGEVGSFPARPELDGTAPGDPPPAASTAGPSLTVEQDKYLLGLKMAFEAQDYPRVLEFAGRLEALGGGLPAEAEFFRGEAEFQVGRFAAAARSLERYVAAADRDDPNYRRALEGLLALEEADDAAYTRAEAGGTSASFGEYLELFPRGRHVEEARERESALQAEEAERRRLDEERRAAERRADDAAFAEAKRLHTPSGYETYLTAYPDGRHVGEVRNLLARAAESVELALGLAPAERERVQLGLASLGYAVGVPDGEFGERSRTAIADYQRGQGLTETGYLTAELRDALVAMGQARQAEAERRRLAEERRAADDAIAARTRAPGQTFRDCALCPEMVVVPAGSFWMGSPDDEEGRFGDEGPVHEVAITAPFVVGKYEVTRGEFRSFVEATGHSTGDTCLAYEDESWRTRPGRSWQEPGYAQADSHPVVCVSWEDAQAYARWLTSATGERYRLPSESEWEYAARAGTTTSRYWGDDPAQGCGYANGADQTALEQYPGGRVAACTDGYVHTAPVGSFAPNAFGLHDLHGNVWEWGEDCWNDSYAGAPSDGSAWTRGNCDRRIARGGSWNGSPRSLRSADRYGARPDSGSTSSVFASPGRLRRESWSPYPGGPRGGAPWSNRVPGRVLRRVTGPRGAGEA